MTLTDLQKLASTEKGRVKIGVMVAELSGTLKECPQCGGYGEIGHGSENRICPCDYGDNDWWTPDYPSDLNACAEFEAELRGNDLERYQHHLEHVVFRFTTDDDWSEELGVSARTKAWHASALHRCIALILTLQETKGAE